MIEESKAPEHKRIDIPSGKFKAGGETFYIQPHLSTTRYVEYLKRVPRLAYNATFRSIYDTLSKIYMTTSSGNDMIYAIQQARELSWNQLDAIKRFDENEIPDIIDFCCLFINKAGEDVSKFDSSVHEAKKEIISKEGYVVDDFFTLAFHLVESFSEGYQKLTRLTKGETMEDISLSPTSLPTNLTSSTQDSEEDTSKG